MHRLAFHTANDGPMSTAPIECAVPSAAGMFRTAISCRTSAVGRLSGYQRHD